MRPHQDSLFHIGHLAIQMDRSGALYLPQHKIMIVADLHFEKATTLHEKRGSALPPFDSRDTLIRLQNIIKKYQPDQFICLGDTWHDSRGPSRMQREDRDILRNIITNCQTNFIIGNHDESIFYLGGRRSLILLGNNY